MLSTSARVVPHIARDCLVSLFGAIVTVLSAIEAVTSLLTTRLNVPRLPLALSVWPESETSTPLGTANRMFANARHRKPQKTRQSTSPPTFAARASLSDMTPRGVESMAIPSPL